jgi:hypothetical protein
MLDRFWTLLFGTIIAVVAIIWFTDNNLAEHIASLGGFSG